MKPKTLVKQYILCPQCEKGEHCVQHLLDLAVDRSFGPWRCYKCKHEFYGEIKDGDVEITKIEKFKTRQMLSLLKFRDIYVVVDFYSDHEDDKPDWYDYLFHSHQCPTNIMGHIQEVFDKDERDPHGLFRFVAAVEDTESNREDLEEVFQLGDLFKFFNTDGKEAYTAWPQENKGVLEFIAKERYKELSSLSPPLDVEVKQNADDKTKIDIEISEKPARFFTFRFKDYHKPLPSKEENFEPLSKETIDKVLKEGEKARDALEESSGSQGIDPKIKFK